MHAYFVQWFGGSAIPCIEFKAWVSHYTNPGYALSLVDTLWNAGSYRQPLEQEGNPMT